MAETVTVQRDARGRVLPGSKLAIGNRGGGSRIGVQPKATIAKRALTAALRLQDRVADDIDTLTGTLLEQAKAGDLNALRLVLNYGLGTPTAATRVDLPELAGLPPDRALEVITAAVGRQEISIEVAQALGALQRQRVEVAILAPLRQIVAGLRRGDPVEALLGQLAALDLGDTIEGEVLPQVGSDQEPTEPGSALVSAPGDLSGTPLGPPDGQ
jgi:hypothetical protein